MSDTLMEFPCQFRIKAMGLTDEGLQKKGLEIPGVAFADHVLELVSRHCVDFVQETSALSSGGKYLSVTVSLEAQSKAQLDAIYQELSAAERVVFVL